MIKVKAPINPTEDVEKVKQAISMIFPYLELKIGENEITGESDNKLDFVNFKELLKQQRIRDTARSFLETRKEGKWYSFELNKQAALMGKINFVDFEVPLGTIHVEMDELPID